MKKTMKKSASKASKRKATRNLEPKAAAAAKVRGGFYAEEHGAAALEKSPKFELKDTSFHI